MSDQVDEFKAVEAEIAELGAKVSNKAEESKIIEASSGLPSTDVVLDTESKETELRKAYNNIISKYDLSDLKYKDFTEIIDGLTEYSKLESDAVKLMISKLAQVTVDSVLLRSIYNLGKLINKALDKVNESLTKMDDMTSLNILISSIERIFGWIDRVQELKKKFVIYNVDKSFELLSNKNKESDSAKLTKADVDLIVKKIRDSNNSNKEG